MNYSINDLRTLANSKEYQEYKKENKKHHILGEKIYGRRKDLGLTQGVLAQQSGIPQNKISQLESGTYGAPGIELLKNLSVALNIDDSYLLEDSVDRKTFEIYNTFLPLIKLDGPGALQFIKIPFFIDLENFKKFGAMMSKFAYIRYNYGPFDKNVYLYQKIFSGNEAGFTQFKQSYLQQKDIDIINTIIQKYPCNNGNKLKELSYESEPMKRIGATIGGTEHWNQIIPFC